MNKFIRVAGVLLLTVSGIIFADEQGYRIAGIIANDTTDWRAIIELPDGKQKLVSEGDVLGQVEVVKISKKGVLLKFPGGEIQLQLSQGERQIQQSQGERQIQQSQGEKQLQQSQGEEIPLPSAAVPVLSREEAEGTGADVADFSKLLDKQLSSDQAAGVTGLEHLRSLYESARLVSYSYINDAETGYTPIDSLKSGVAQIQKAIIEGKGLRITVKDDPKNTHIYILPNYKDAGL